MEDASNPHGEPEDAPERTRHYDPSASGGADDPDLAVIDKLAPFFRRVRRYCRVTVEGLENLPQTGAVLVANHTGWTGLDHANLFLTLYDRDGRIPRTAVHPTFYRVPWVREMAPKLGFYEVSVTRSIEILDRNGLILFFPEAEEGNFKSILQKYRLEAFKPGFARVALASMRPIVPVVIVGGEEANPSLARIDALKRKTGLSLPVPVNLVPFPVKWRIRFMEPIHPEEYLKGDAVDTDVATTIAQDVRERMQREIEVQLEKRGNPLW